MKSKPKCQTSRKDPRTSGFVLVTALIFLVVLSMLTVMALRRSLFEERMAGNDQDTYIAREAAEMALRDAERDVLGQRFDGQYCAAVGSSTCGGNLRPAGTRPGNATDAGNFWIASNPQFQTVGAGTVSSAARPSPVSGTNLGVYTGTATTACGKALWLAADWDAASPATTRRCTDASSIVRTVVFGEFTGAPNTFGANARLPRYLIEVFDAQDMGIYNSNKIFVRITAVGFGRLVNDDQTLTSVTLQSVFSPL